MTDLDLTLIAPWADDTPDLLTRTLTHTATATVVMPDGETYPLELDAGSVSFDDTRAPRVSASLTCKVPDDQALLDRVDPRTGARVAITAGYVRPGGTSDVHDLADLGIRGRRVSRPADELSIDALSDEALVIDDGPTNGGHVTTTTTVAAITAVVRLIFPGLVIDTTGTPAGPAVDQTPLGDKWTTVQDLADRIEAQLYDDGLRGWHLLTPPTIATPALALTVGEGGTITASDTGLTREDGFANQVFLTYEWRDASDVDHTIVSVRRITSGPYAATAGNIRTLEVTRDIPATQAEANAAATALVRRTVTRGRSFRVTAPAAYWLRPGHPVELTLPLGGPELHLVSAVEFDLRAGVMDVTTRLPDGNYTIGA